MVELDKPVEKSSREKIADEVYTWRRGYNPDLQNDTYGGFESVFDCLIAELPEIFSGRIGFQVRVIDHIRYFFY